MMVYERAVYRAFVRPPALREVKHGDKRMDINAGLAEKTLRISRSLLEHLYDLGQYVLRIERGSYPNMYFTLPEAAESFGRGVDHIEKLVIKLVQIHPELGTDPRFEIAVSAARKLKGLVRREDLERIRKFDEDTDSILSDYTGNLLLSIIDLLDVIAAHNISLHLSGFADDVLTSAFLRQNPQAAVQYAFTIFEDHLRKRLNVGPDIFGENLINKAFGDCGILTYGATSAEERGVRNFIAGAYSVFRNPSMHRITVNEEETALSIIILVDMLIKLVDTAEYKTVSKS